MAKIENKHDIQGRILHLGGIEPIPNYDNLRKRIVVVEQENPRTSTPWEVPVEFFNQNIDLCRSLRVGDLVHVTFRVRGKKRQDKEQRSKWWPTIEGLMISKVTG